MRRLPIVLAFAVLASASCRSADDGKKPVSQLNPSPSTSAIVISTREEAPSHLVVMLHGVGADAASFQSLGRVLSQSLPSAEFLVPDGLQRYDMAATGRQWFSIRDITVENRPARVRGGASAVSGYIDAELAKRGLDGDKLVLVGFSQGAIVSAWLAVHRTPRPAAVVLLSGRVAEADIAIPGDGPPIFMGHGARDQVMPVSVLEPGANVLKAWGARVTTRIYPELAHQVSPDELSDVSAFLRQVLKT